MQSVARLDRVEGHPVGAGPWRRYTSKLRPRASPLNTAGRCCASVAPDGSGVYANVELARHHAGSAAAVMGSGTVVIHERREMTARRCANGGETMTEHGGGITMTENLARGAVVHEHTVRSR